MKVLVACECSGTVRDAFIENGHDAYSCDLEPSDTPGPHFQQDIFEVIDQGWDLMIAHPPCTFLTTTGARWLYDKRYPNRFQDRDKAVEFFLRLAEADIPKIAVENPIGHISTAWRKPDQIIQPYHFGHDASKATCLWLKNLPKLTHTEVVEPSMVEFPSGRRMSKWFVETSAFKGKERQKIRSKTFQGIADAMAEQWG